MSNSNEIDEKSKSKGENDYQKNKSKGINI
jgi:hypothetical protein